MQPRSYLAALLTLIIVSSSSAQPPLLDDQFRLPQGFHIYKAAPASLCGGSYDITLDGEGRLLVGDGTAVRRLTDSDGDQVYDQQEVIATGLGGRGPQGLLVDGDRLYAVGGDGIQLFTGYQSGGPLQHKGRLGQPFNTGGDHAAHTILRGLDGYLYFVCGDGGGTDGRRHITESSSPVIFERKGSVFRFDPAGEYWECISAGGRNAPSLGMNYLGEFFSFDSDMEWHVDLPWYRPVRLNHWAIGGDQGWQSVGAYPPYYIDNLPPVMEVGRGSPNWGIFYEHTQLPADYADAFLCCDYRWKSATKGSYNSSGRLVAFHLQRKGARWQATMETLAEARPGARDPAGQAINFALVDVDVAPDGSLLVSDHNQGVWRIYFGSGEQIPTLVGDAAPQSPLTIPQPGAEWSRVRQRTWLRSSAGADSSREHFLAAARSPERTVRERLRALRHLAPEFRTWPKEHLQALAGDSEPEIRGQAAWLLGIRRQPGEASTLIQLLQDTDGFVRRRAAEALGRLGSDLTDGQAVSRALVSALNDSERAVRYASMTALAHLPQAQWWEHVAGSSAPQVRMRGLVASRLRQEPLPASEIQTTVAWLLSGRDSSREHRLDLLRILSLFREPIQADANLEQPVATYLLAGLADDHRDLRWEHARLAGDYALAEAIPPLLSQLLAADTPPVTQFHLADALSRIPAGWTDATEETLWQWLTSAQHGWFTEFDGKGRQFPSFWATVLDRLVEHHLPRVIRGVDDLRPGSQLTQASIAAMAEAPAAQLVLRRWLDQASPDQRRQIVTRTLAPRRVQPELWPLMLSELLEAGEGGRAPLANWISRQDASATALVNRAATAGVSLADPRSTLAHAMISLLQQDREAARAERALRTLFPQAAPQQAEGSKRAVRLAAQEAWQAWYRDEFGVPFLMAAPSTKTPQMDNASLHALILAGPDGSGDVGRGRRVYLEATCYACHGGLEEQQTVVFGPDLAGVTKRLKPVELADALITPSKQVAERFRNTLVLTNDGRTWSGVLTERSPHQLVLVNADNVVQRIPAADVEAVRSLETSPMPDQLLNRFRPQQIQDLLSFLHSLE